MNKRKIIGILLVCILILFCTACQKDDMNEEIATSKVEAGMYKEVSIDSENNSEEKTVQDNNIQENKNIEKPEQENRQEQVKQEELEETLEESPIKRVLGEDTSEVGSHETENTNYALYPSTIVETNPKDKPSRFGIWEKTMNITFPQIYYSNEYENYHGSEIETTINHDLFMYSMGNSDSFLVGRDGRLLREYTTDYEITKADDELISIKYYGECLSVFRDNDLCRGDYNRYRNRRKVSIIRIYNIGRQSGRTG